ncbi:hypothetical protein B0H66DRAFT_620890, partial [Apodospora peruviana]
GVLNVTTYPATVTLSTLTVPNYSSQDKSTATTTFGSSGPRRHVIQDPTATRVMQGPLGAMLLCSLLSWALARQTAVLPRPPTSIASAFALLVDGNIYDVGDGDKLVGNARQLHRRKGGGASTISGTTYNVATRRNGDEIGEKTEKRETRYGFWLGTRSPSPRSELTTARRVPEAEGLITDGEGEDQELGDGGGENGKNTARLGIWVIEM